MDQTTIDLFKTLNPDNQLDPAPNTLIVGARSPETAVAVTDYPYGRRMRCIMRYWLETKAKNGTRLVAQTNNPKKPGLVWNKPHAETYTDGAVVLHTNDDGHVKQRALTMYSLQASDVLEAERALQKVDEFNVNYAEALNEQDQAFITLALARTLKRLDELNTPHVKTPADTSCPTCKNYGQRCIGTD